MSTLLLGYPGPLAVRAAHRLAESGGPLLVVGREEAGASLPRGCEFLGGAGSSIDFGLGRRQLARLAGEVTEVVVAESLDHETRPVSDTERASVVRVAAEVREFIAEQTRPVGVRFLSSLRVFGRWNGSASESDFAVGQTFSTAEQEALAVAEKQLRLLPESVEMAIVRVGPIVGSERHGIWKVSDVARLLSLAQLAPDEVEVQPSEELVLFETVERAVDALLTAPRGRRHLTYHVIDEEPWSERKLVEWVCERWHKRLITEPPRVSGWNQVLSGTRGRAWKATTFPTIFGRMNAEAALGEFLHRDAGAMLTQLAEVPQTPGRGRLP